MVKICDVNLVDVIGRCVPLYPDSLHGLVGQIDLQIDGRCVACWRRRSSISIRYCCAALLVVTGDALAVRRRARVAAVGRWRRRHGLSVVAAVLYYWYVVIVVMVFVIRLCLVVLFYFIVVFHRILIMLLLRRWGCVLLWWRRLRRAELYWAWRQTQEVFHYFRLEYHSDWAYFKARKIHFYLILTWLRVIWKNFFDAYFY